MLQEEMLQEEMLQEEMLQEEMWQEEMLQEEMLQEEMTPTQACGGGAYSSRSSLLPTSTELSGNRVNCVCDTEAHISLAILAVIWASVCRHHCLPARLALVTPPAGFGTTMLLL